VQRAIVDERRPAAQRGIEGVLQIGVERLEPLVNEVADLRAALRAAAPDGLPGQALTDCPGDPGARCGKELSLIDS
jgi:hypothetical protein